MVKYEVKICYIIPVIHKFIIIKCIESFIYSNNLIKIFSHSNSVLLFLDYGVLAHDPVHGQHLGILLVEFLVIHAGVLITNMAAPTTNVSVERDVLDGRAVNDEYRDNTSDRASDRRSLLVGRLEREMRGKPVRGSTAAGSANVRSVTDDEYSSPLAPTMSGSRSM